MTSVPIYIESPFSPGWGGREWSSIVKRILTLALGLIVLVSTGCVTTTTTGGGPSPVTGEMTEKEAADLFSLGLLAYDSSNLEVSLDYLNQAIALAGTGAAARTQMLLVRAEVYGGLGNRELAEADIREVIAASPNSAEAYFVSALVNYQGDNLAGAERDLQQALTLDPHYARAHNLKGNIFKARGDLEGALSAYNDAITSDDTFGPAYFNRAEIDMAGDHFEAAVDDYSSAISRYTELQKRYLAQAYCGRAEAFSMLGNTEMAQRDRKKAESLVPGFCAEEAPTGPRWGKGEFRPQ
jgi:tetratricopeptide (TPR) repeat protein